MDSLYPFSAMVRTPCIVAWLEKGPGREAEIGEIDDIDDIDERQRDHREIDRWIDR